MTRGHEMLRRYACSPSAFIPAKHFPHARSATAVFAGPFDLVRGGSSAPHKIFWKLHNNNPLFLGITSPAALHWPPRHSHVRRGHNRTAGTFPLPPAFL